MGLYPFIPFRENYPSRQNDFVANDEIFIENNNLENEDDFTDNENLQDDDNTSKSDDSGENNGNENYRLSSYMLFTPTLEDLKNVLYVALNPFFEEFEIAVISCLCLTREPYNLAAAGLSGNTGILKMGNFKNFYPRPRTDFAFDIQQILSSCSNDVFVIGSGFAAKPSMSYNGNLTMNAVVSANPTNVINNSCIAYENAGEIRLEIINDPNQIKCSLLGHFFFNEGKRGPVIKIRAKSSRSICNIIKLIQGVLNARYQHAKIGLGIILIINGGRTIQFILPENYVECNYHTYMDYCIKLRSYEHEQNCINLIALGALINDPLIIIEQDFGNVFIDSRYKFNIFSNSEAVGEFFDYGIPEETEYIAYLNIAQEIYSARRF
ncbi:hypothetical protein ACFW04_005131 [Cataglyphis niger]